MKLNRHQIAGRIVEDPEYGSIPGSGVPTVKLRVVTDDGWYDTKKQEYQKNNQYHTVKKVGKDVDDMELRKDDWVFVEGSQRTDTWEDRDGNKRYANYIRATIIVEIPDPWEKSNQQRGGRGGTDSGRDSGRSRPSDRGRDDRRDDRRGSGYSDRGQRQDNRGRDDRGHSDKQSRRADDIPF